MKFKGTICAIPARSGSKRIPNKNIKLLGDYPLIAYSIFTSRASYFIDRTIVSTDSPEIAEIAYHCDSEIIMRPPELAQDNSTDLKWVLHFLEKIHKKGGIYPKNIVFLRPTTPYREVSVVDTAISSLKENNSSLRSVEEIPEAVEKTFRITEDSLLIPSYPNLSIDDTNNPNQTFPIGYRGNGYIDILRSEYILEHKSLYGNKIQAFITSKTIEIDTLEDFEYAEFLLRRKNE